MFLGREMVIFLSVYFTILPKTYSKLLLVGGVTPRRANQGGP